MEAAKSCYFHYGISVVILKVDDLSMSPDEVRHLVLIFLSLLNNCFDFSVNFLELTCKLHALYMIS